MQIQNFSSLTVFYSSWAFFGHIQLIHSCDWGSTFFFSYSEALILESAENSNKKKVLLALFCYNLVKMLPTSRYVWHSVTGMFLTSFHLKD